MRLMRLTVDRSIPFVDPSVDRVLIFNNRYRSDGTVIELLAIEGGGDLQEAFAGNDSTIEFEIVEETGDHRYVYHHLRPDAASSEHQLMSLLETHRLIPFYPIVLDTEAGASITLAGTQQALTAAFRSLPDAIRRAIKIEQLSDFHPNPGQGRQLLTARQREILDVATELGYYSIPREATAADVAAAVDCAPSTASEHLRKIESEILSDLASD